MLLRRINLLYLAIPVLCWVSYRMMNNLRQNVASFYGFAENKETEINLDHPLTVRKVHVRSGQFVTKGTLLLEVERTALDFKMNELSVDIAQVASEDAWRTSELRARIAQAQAEMSEKTGNIRSEIRQAEADLQLRANLSRGLKTVSVADSTTSVLPMKVKIDGLREELRLAEEPFDKEIDRLNQEIRLAGKPSQMEIGKLRKEVSMYEAEKGRLVITAPTDGLVGNVHCKEGENISSFNPLISFYEKSPNTVVGFLHESLSLQLNVGDSLLVISSLHPNEKAKGRVTGLGHRIVEIPERLRKIPEIRSYGREILIEIPTDNHFLQKEKVILQFKGINTNWLSEPNTK